MKRVPFTVICAAKQYDPEAVKFVLNHFEGYIAKRCLSACADEEGRIRSLVDEDLRYEAVNALFAAIEGFRFREPPDDFMG